MIWILCWTHLAHTQTPQSKVREELISLDVVEKPFSAIIEDIREQTGQNLVYDPAAIAEVLVTIRLVNVHWRTALRTIASQCKCVVEERDGGIISITKPPVVSMELEEADIGDVINYIAGVADKNIVLSPQVKGNKVSLRFKSVPWQDALETIVRNSGFVLVREQGDILRIVSPKEIEAQMETEVFPLRYIRPKSIYIAKMSSGTSHFDMTQQQQQGLQQQLQQASQKGAIQVSQFSLLAALNTVVTPKGKITYDEMTNTLIITDIKTQIEKMKDIIKQLDKEPKQIFIDVKFIRTTNTDIFDFGIDSDGRGIRISQTLGSLTTRFPFTLGRGGFEDAIAAAPKSVIEAPGPGIPNIFPENPITFGVLDFSKTSFTLRLLKRDVKSKIVQAPKIITLDHHEATIFVGRSISFAESEIQQNDNGSVTIEIKEAQKSPAQEGFQMLVIPHTLQDTQKIQLTIILSNDTLTGSTSTTVRGFNKFEVGGVSIDLPESTRQIIVTHMLLESGQTAVLGGLLAINQSESITKIPFLGDIPFIGYMFKNKTISKTKEDLFIFLTPKIVQSAEATQEKVNAMISESQEKHAAQYNTIWQDQKEIPMTLPTIPGTFEPSSASPSSPSSASPNSRVSGDTTSSTSSTNTKSSTENTPSREGEN